MMNKEFVRTMTEDQRVPARCGGAGCTKRPTGAVRRAFGDQYQDVLPMFATLEHLSPALPARRHQREMIITRCLPLADHVAGHFSRRGESLDDLVQVARIGLVQAVDRFDTSKGADFVAFAVPTMMGEVRRYFRDHGWSMHVPRGLRDLHVRISRTTAELLQLLGRTPTASELAERLGVDRNVVVDCLIAGDAYQLRSLDAPVSDSDGDGEGRCVADTIGDVDRQIEAVTDHETVCSLLGTLSDRERRIVEMRFFDAMTQTQIATQIGVSQMQVSRILTRTMAKLRTAV